MASNTKFAILAAYANLITQKNIDKVTVKDVVDICGITRQTFYYHFQDPPGQQRFRAGYPPRYW